MTDYLAVLEELPGIIGALLCTRDGSVVENTLPAAYDPDQVRRAGATLHYGLSGLEEKTDRLQSLEFAYRKHLVRMYVTADHLLLVLMETGVNRAVLERIVTPVLEHLAQAPAPEAGAQENSGAFENPPAAVGRRRRWPVLLLLLLLIGGAGVFGWQYSASRDVVPQQSAAAPVTILRLQGSNTIGARLAPELARAYLLARGAAGQPHIERVSDVDTYVTASVEGQPAPLRITVSAHGSSTAFVGLQEGRADVGMASRPIKTAELQKLATLGNLAGPNAEQVLAMDGLAIVVHPGNRARSLSIDQLAGLFSGKIADWSQIPASELRGPVHVYARDDKSGTYDTLKSLVLKPYKVSLAAEAKRYEDSNQLSIDVANDPQGIGFIGLPYIKPAQGVAIADAGVQAIYPNSFTVATEDYPLSRRLFLYLPPNTENLHARRFVSFALSEAGQKVVRQVGFIDLLVAEEQVSEAARSAAPPNYRHITRLANRLSLNFRFLSGSNRLDNKGLQDVQRLVAFLREDKNLGRQIRLLGFTDSIGDHEQNCSLSLRRARAVEKILNGYGIYPLSVDGVCDAMPVASNESAAGRDKNRRVEVWVDQ